MPICLSISLFGSFNVRYTSSIRVSLLLSLSAMTLPNALYTRTVYMIEQGERAIRE